VGGVRISRKHIGWYINPLPGGKDFTSQFNKLDSTMEQRALLQQFFARAQYQEQAA
jgi:tRNA-dihydrouridine synthase B